MSTDYRPPKGLKPGDTVRVVNFSAHDLRTVKTVGRKWLTLDGLDHRRRIDMEAGEYDRSNYSGAGDVARVYRPEDPAGWADVHRIKVHKLLREARRVAKQYDGIGARATVNPEDEARAVIAAYTALLDAISNGPTNPEPPARTRAPHQHEAWQVHDDGNGPYCRACGEPVTDTEYAAIRAARS